MSDRYNEWGARHASLFGLRSEQDAASVSEWVDLFRKSGITVEELNRASDWLALHQPPKWASEHLGALKSTVELLRQQAQSASEPPDRGQCTLCRGGGMVSVPHPRFMLGLVQPDHPRKSTVFTTAAVLCRCPLGRWTDGHRGDKRSDGQERPRMMTLDAYEAVYPNWRAVVEQHETQSAIDLCRQRGQRSGTDEQEWEKLVDSITRKVHDASNNAPVSAGDEIPF